MLLFRSEEHVRRWYGDVPGASMSVEQQWQLADAWYAHRMSPEWRRWTPAEAEQLFASIGLVGEFWRLVS